jgi:hypothetical protein
LEKRIEQISDEEFCKGTLALDFESVFPKGTGDQVDYKFDRDRLCVCHFQDPLEKRIQDAELLRDLYVRNGKEH